jgi:holo-[acyl-carrier protein] synthase
MMDSQIFGIGTDIIAVERIKNVLSRHPVHFPEKYFTTEERAYCDACREPAERYAARFAAKEAVAKALGTGFGEHLNFLDVEICRDTHGKPYAVLSDRAQTFFGKLQIHLSISHCHEYATATAIVAIVR